MTETKLKANIDFIEFQSDWYNKVMDKSQGGVYLISTESFFKNGICKIGIASNFHKRFHAFKSCYGWYEGFYIFGLIPFKISTESRELERKLLKKFDNIRIIYPYTERSTEWLLIDVEEIKKIFSQFPNSITKFEGLAKAPPVDVSEIKFVKETTKGYLVKFPDNSTAVQTSSLFKDLVPEKLKKTNPLMIGSGTGMTQKKYEEIWESVPTLYTPKEIRDWGGITKIAKHLAETMIKEYQAKQRSKRVL